MKNGNFQRVEINFDELALSVIDMSQLWMRDGYTMTYRDLSILQAQDYTCHYCLESLLLFSQVPTIRDGKAYCESHKTLNNCQVCGETEAHVSRRGLCVICETALEKANQETLAES